jgi:hypothetical protein
MKQPLGSRRLYGFELRDILRAAPCCQLPAIAGSVAMLRWPQHDRRGLRVRECAKRRQIDRPVNEPGITHFCLQTSSMAESSARLKTAPAAGSLPSRRISVPISSMPIRAIPDRNVIELECLPDR